jgi:hypothetical protein
LRLLTDTKTHERRVELVMPSPSHAKGRDDAAGS